MNELRAIYQKNPLVEQIDLNNQNIRDSDHIFSFLENFKNLKEV